ncbi:MAG TPA: TatD family hydrolase [Candidatus Cloacimonadota bacterium]|nr:TatD family hydrolase [Candidatus Cloacimonadota bacterium]
MNYCDAHCHLANLSQIMPLEPLFEEAAAHKLTCFLSSALSRTELDWYAEHSKAYNILYSAGIHPSFEPCDLQFEDIEGLCRDGKIWAIGEIGLDKGNPEYALMKANFVKQLDLAMDYRLPVVLHIVGHQQEAYEILKVYPLKYLIHGYAGSVQAFRQFLKLDSYFTISERILKEDKHDLLKEILQSRRFLFESDITQYYVRESEANPLLRLENLVLRIAEIFKVDPAILQRLQAANYQLLTGHKI